jgi:hypothetical protein
MAISMTFAVRNPRKAAIRKAAAHDRGHHHSAGGGRSLHRGGKMGRITRTFHERDGERAVVAALATDAPLLGPIKALIITAILAGPPGCAGDGRGKVGKEFPKSASL